MSNPVEKSDEKKGSMKFERTVLKDIFLYI